jgi:hypothetical protein
MDSLLTAFGINGKLLLAQLINFGVLFAGHKNNRIDDSCT